MTSYDMPHVVGLEETNVVGNVYFVNHLRWQGRCRELFLREYAPEVLGELAAGLSLATVRCSCDYVAELSAFDEIVVRMFLADLTQTRLVLRFEYHRRRGGREELVARGEQEIACLRRVADGPPVAAGVPEALRRALAPFQPGAAELVRA